MNLPFFTAVSITLLIQCHQGEARKAGTPLRIASFNIQDLGDSKVGKPEVVDVLVKILRDYDIVAIQEIVDKDQDAFPKFMEALNSQAGSPYTYVISDRVGRGTAKEQYAYIYRPSRVKVTNAWTFDDSRSDIFEREPHIAILEASDSSVPQFTAVNIHTKPTDAVVEVDALAAVVDELRKRFFRGSAQNILVLGDYNADCNYVTQDDWSKIALRTRSEFTWWIADSVDTTVKDTDCAYDRFVTAGKDFEGNVVPSSAKARNFQTEFDLTDEEAAAVSDHYPIEIQIQPSTGRIEAPIETGPVGKPAEPSTVSAPKNIRGVEQSISVTVKNKEVPADAMRMLVAQGSALKGFNPIRELFDRAGTLVEISLMSAKESSSLSVIMKLVQAVGMASPGVATSDVINALDFKLKNNVLTDNSVTRQPTRPKYLMDIRCRIVSNSNNKWECDFTTSMKTSVS